MRGRRRAGRFRRAGGSGPGAGMRERQVQRHPVQPVGGLQQAGALGEDRSGHERTAGGEHELLVLRVLGADVGCGHGQPARRVADAVHVQRVLGADGAGHARARPVRADERELPVRRVLGAEDDPDGRGLGAAEERAFGHGYVLQLQGHRGWQRDDVQLVELRVRDDAG